MTAQKTLSRRLISGLMILGLIVSLTACSEPPNAEPPIADPPISESKAPESISPESISPESIASESTTPKSPSESAVPVTQIKVLRVVDGDTLEIDMDGKEKLRLIGVNTPETHHPSKPVEEYGPEAEAFTRKQLEGKTIYLEFDVEERDHYGRLLGYVWLDIPLAESEEELKSKLFNAKLLTEGYAQVMTVPPNVKYSEIFLKLQSEARQSGKGLWGLPEDEEIESASGGKNSGRGASKDAAEKGPNGETIKGNINSKGEKIYHLPGGQFYAQTVPEAWFFTEEEAQAAGFRASKR